MRKQPDVPISHKRNAEEALGQPREKVAKTGHPVVASAGSGRLPSNTSIANARLATVLRTNPSLAYGESSRQNPMSKPSIGSNALPRSQVPKSDQEVPSKKEPKKGSYAEIMARAKASQAKPQAVGTISHKPKGKGALTYKQELKLQKQAKRDRRLGLVRDKDGSRPSSADDAPKPGKLGKKGIKPDSTMSVKKPKPQPAYKGTMNPASVTARAKEKAAAQTARRGNEYAGTDDDLDDEDDMQEDDDYGYDEDESDDMEAGFLDVEEEETAATLAARKEDEEEAKLEAKLKRDKEERKRRMEELAKRAKPQRY